jgi:hypothetical protein
MNDSFILVEDPHESNRNVDLQRAGGDGWESCIVALENGQTKNKDQKVILISSTRTVKFETPA